MSSSASARALPQGERQRSMSRVLLAIAERSKLGDEESYLGSYLPIHSQQGDTLDELLAAEDVLDRLDQKQLIASIIAGFGVAGAGNTRASSVVLVQHYLSDAVPSRRRRLRQLASLQIGGSDELWTDPEDAATPWPFVTFGSTVSTSHVTLTGHTGSVESVAFGAVNNRTVLASASRDETVRLWDPTTGTPIGQPLTGHTNSVVSVAFGAVNNQTVLASASRDETVRLWDPTTGTPIGQPLTGHTNWVVSVAFGTVNNQTVLASASWDNTVRLWDPTTGTPIGQPLTGHTNIVASVAFGTVNNQTVLASASSDETVRLWDPTTGTPIGQPLTGHTNSVASVAFGTVNNQTVLASTSGNSLTVERLSPKMFR